jgi:MraZ protein
MVFRGGPVLTLDGKGRLGVPTRWRELLMANVQGQMVVAKNPDGCLSLFPLPVWENFESSVLALATLLHRQCHRARTRRRRACAHSAGTA